jgi:hypothetical protein
MEQRNHEVSRQSGAAAGSAARSAPEASYNPMGRAGNPCRKHNHWPHFYLVLARETEKEGDRAVRFHANLAQGQLIPLEQIRVLADKQTDRRVQRRVRQIDETLVNFGPKGELFIRRTSRSARNKYWATVDANSAMRPHVDRWRVDVIPKLRMALISQ